MASTAAKLITLLSGGNYLSTILSTGPVALWPLSETAGASSVTDSVAGFTGTPTDVTFGATTFPDGTAAPSFNGTTSLINIYSAGLAAAFSPTAGSLFSWLRLPSGVWTDSTGRVAVNLGADASNFVRTERPTTNNLYRGAYSAGGTNSNVLSTIGVTTWFHYGLTWNKALDRVRVFWNGTQAGTDQTSMGTWAGALANNRTVIGGSTTGPLQPFSGNIKYVGLWNRELTPAEVALLAPAAFQV